MIRSFRRCIHSKQCESTTFKHHQWKFYESTVIKDKQSKFQSRHVDLTSSDQIPLILQALVDENKAMAKASHPHMIAWRVEKNGAIDLGFKDNGEKGAGSLLLDLLIKYDLKNILIICTRWYGGKPIGGARFRHIKASALQSLKIGDKISRSG